MKRWLLLCLPYVPPNMALAVAFTRPQLLPAEWWLVLGLMSAWAAAAIDSRVRP